MVQNTKSAEEKNWILAGILAAIAAGIIIGGWLPEIAIQFSILGDIFLNAIMMIVVPLVIFSMIDGITKLGNIRSLGSIGWKTILYYMATTALSVIIGLVLVNIINPGSDITSGETHHQIQYTIDSNDNTILHLPENTLEKTEYNDKYILRLLDQQLLGSIQYVENNTIKVSYWISETQENIRYLITEEGTRIPIIVKEEQILAHYPEVQQNGEGIQITLSIAAQIADKKERDLLDVVEEVLLGSKENGKEGLIPRNIFNAMVQMNILPIILFSLFLGAALSVIGQSAKSTIQMISTINEAIMRLVKWIMYVAPFGIFGLVCARIGKAGGFEGFLPELYALGKYTLTITIGLAIHGLVILPLILWIMGKRNPFRYMFGVGPALLNAFSTASSSATLPLTLNGVIKENQVQTKTASFVLPLGATINMDGTALYEAVAVMFIAQVYGIPMGGLEQILIFLTATLAAIGAAGIPEAGLVTMVIVLNAVGLPVEGIGLILTIDWLLDRFRTTVNVWGDCVGSAVIDQRV